MPVSFAFVAACLLAVPVAPACAQTAREDADILQAELAARYGFSGLHISKLDDGVAGLVAGDLDGDGRIDLAIVNNSKARIDLLLQRRGDDEGTGEADADAEQVNALPDETWFHRDSFPTEEKVASLALADVDGDGRADLLITGDSGRLTVAFRDAEGFGRVLRLKLDESAVPGSVRSGDLDGDGRLDVVVLGKESTWLYMQRADGELGEAVALPNATKGVDDLRVVDLDGDGRLDLLYVVMESEWPLRWRLGAGGGAFGPQVTTRFTPIRSLALADVDGDGGSEVATVRRRSGRLTLLRYADAVEEPGGPLALSALRTVPFAPLKDSARRQVTLTDLDGDGRPDLLAAEPSAARIVVHRGGAGYAALTCPSFLGASHPRVADLDGDGRMELVVASPEENAVGISAVGADGRVGFPRAVALPGGGELLALDAVSAPRGGVWLVLADGKGRSRTHRLVALDAQGGVVATHALSDLDVDPAALSMLDLDRDGTLDALIFVPTELPRILLLPAGDAPRALAVADVPGLGLLKGIERRAVFHGDVDGDGMDELLVPGSNFVRAFHLDADGLPIVVTQVNLPDPGSQAVAAAGADLDGDGDPEVLVVERSSNMLQIHSRNGETWGLTARVDLGDQRPRGLLTADLDGDGRTDILLDSADAFGCVMNGARDAGLVADLDFETPIKDAYLDQLAFGDLTGDGTVDVVMTDTTGHKLAIAAVHRDAILHALRFPVYEGRLFESGRGGREPREVLVADVTGDRRDDVALVVHDRVIVYPQE